ncbi:HAD domain-containing protein [Sorangium sp. So ce1000]|uniref:HAD domain-containing protein n=1 Tax=Sorangium sp. So ce1000 TaxID=3133325 RepID=UPI003F6178F3
MKVLFLDFDGVLNDLLTITQAHGAGARRFSAGAIDRLNTIVARTGARVVVTSSWREKHTLDALRALLASEGFTGEILDCTPVLHARTAGARDLEPGQTRCREIQAWLDRQPEPPERFAVLDDIELELLTAVHVKTEVDAGLCDEHVEVAISLLGTD